VRSRDMYASASSPIHVSSPPCWRCRCHAPASEFALARSRIGASARQSMPDIVVQVTFGWAEGKQLNGTLFFGLSLHCYLSIQPQPAQMSRIE
jgi:hypothetical protein